MLTARYPRRYYLAKIIIIIYYGNPRLEKSKIQNQNQTCFYTIVPCIRPACSKLRKPTVRKSIENSFLYLPLWNSTYLQILTDEGT